MSFNHGLKIGQKISTYRLQEIFKHNRYKGMRHSVTTNTLVLISDHYKSPYSDRWEEGILYYNGMGLVGNQKIDYMQNKILAESNTTGIEVYLCEVFDTSPDKYIFMGRVRLAGEPFIEKQFDKEGTVRDVWVFPIKPLDLDANNYALPKEIVERASNSVKKRKELKKLDAVELEKRAKLFQGNIGSRKSTVTTYVRNTYVSEYTKLRANGKCELCEDSAPFLNKEGEPYLETHHIIWLSKGGKDTVNNTVALCPNCHRKMHSLNIKSDVDILINKVKHL
nr:HNH endonuclease [Solibacillus silvestris]